jgi:hypothetical protein
LTKLLAFLAVACCVLAAGASAAEFGANDDTGKYLGANSGPYYASMAALGLRTNVIGLHWEPSLPNAIPAQLVLDPAMARAEAAGIRVVLALYPARPTVFTSERATPAAFAEWAALVARTYPQVRRFVIGNEPNQPRFWRPQFRPRGGQASAAAFGAVLAAAYDRLKSVDRGLTVSGVGLSPRGNDRPDAPNNVSTSPVRFLKGLGDWYRSNGRRRPLMDSFAFHPYPVSNRDRLDRGYVWPNAGVADLGRIKQALWDAFHGTAQPTTANGLTLDLDEVGWQVDTSRDAGYEGDENVVVTDERSQARVYGSLVRLIGCDPTVATVNLFGFRDEPRRNGWQAGVMRLDGTLRPAAGALQVALLETGGGCLGKLTGWRVAKSVVGAKVDFGRLSRPRPAVALIPSFTVTAREEALVRAAVFPAGTSRSRIARELARPRAPRAAVRGVGKANRIGRVVPSGRLRRPGRYVVAVRLAAWANQERVTLVVSRPFRVVAAPKSPK